MLQRSPSEGQVVTADGVWLLKPIQQVLSPTRTVRKVAKMLKSSRGSVPKEDVDGDCRQEDYTKAQ